MKTAAAVMEEAMAGGWFRFYDEVVNDPKCQNLRSSVFKRWINCLCLASTNGGVLPPVSALVFTFRDRRERIESDLEALIAAGLLERTAKGLEPHNWKSRQFKSDGSTERVKRFRNGKRNGAETLHETGPDYRLQTTEKNNSRTNTSLEAACEAFWQAYPHHVGELETRSELETALAKSSLADILSGLRRYVATKPPDQHWMNPATFLRNERWRDQPAPPPSTEGVMKVGL